VTEGAEIQIELVEVDRHDAGAAVGKLDGIDVCVGGAAQLVGKRVKVRVERVLDGTAYASLTRRAKGPEPLTAEAEAEKPTRKPPARKDAADGTVSDAVETEELEEADEADEADEAEEAEEIADGDEVEETDSGTALAPAKKKTRRGSRGGRNRKKPTTIHLPPDELGKPRTTEESQPAAAEAEPVSDTETPETPETPEAPSENGGEPRKKKTRRGSRGGKNRRKKPAGATAAAAAAASENGSEPDPEPEAAEELDPVLEPEPEPEAETQAAQEEDWGYVPMSEWGDEFTP
jgi:predicted RNA-binding protein with TRAM domain